MRYTNHQQNLGRVPFKRVVLLLVWGGMSPPAATFTAGVLTGLRGLSLAVDEFVDETPILETRGPSPSTCHLPPMTGWVDVPAQPEPVLLSGLEAKQLKQQSVNLP